MEDIEDLLVGSGGAPPGFRLPLAAAVGVNPNRKKIQPNLRKASLVEDSLTTPRSLKIPGTQDNLYEGFWMFA
ncbi:hypothetical protein F0562_002964 [Nyssa sinensis]|uniref:Uncharacterized protein n=1 Tax=Nyssa sinensis TaxID=561372 RepID=A0A5J5BX72_9ASTE|nr:hypothetical protein F0562_002964 [Nyssa sinensis]